MINSDTDVVEALRGHARPLDTIRPGSGSADLQPVRDLVAGAQVVGLGEGSHGASEHFLLKHRLIELLVEQEGFRHVAIEASEAACEAIDSSVVDGDGDLAAALSGQGYTAWDTEEVGALLRWLRRYNAGRDRGDRVRFHGLDHGFNAHGRDIVRRYMTRVAPVVLPEVDDAFAGLDDLEARWPSRLHDREDVLMQSWKGIQALTARLQEQKSLGSEHDRAIRAVDRMAAWTGPEREDRSRLMGENVLGLLEREPGAKVVVWAHNAHIGVGQPQPGPSLGEVLRGPSATATSRSASSSARASATPGGWNRTAPGATSSRSPFRHRPRGASPGTLPGSGSRSCSSTSATLGATRH